MIRVLQAANGDVVVVAGANRRPYGDIRECANKLFANHGRGMDRRGRTTGC